MMNTEIKVTRQPDGRYIVSADGANIEAPTLGAALDILRSETGDTASSAKWEELKAENAKLRAVIDSVAHDLESVTADRDRYKDWWYKLHEENRQLKAAICKWFLRAFKEGTSDGI